VLDPLILMVSELCAVAAVSPTAALTPARRITGRMAADEPIVEQGCFSMMGTEVDRRVKQRLLLLTDAHHAWIGWAAKGWKSLEMVNIDDFTSLFLLQTLPGMNQLVDRCC
tara:strand:- start:5267 stop:5599 length:333 start_codon:yes stop_codon:yes gene_type:complete